MFSCMLLTGITLVIAFFTAEFSVDTVNDSEMKFQIIQKLLIEFI